MNRVILGRAILLIEAGLVTCLIILGVWIQTDDYRNVLVALMRRRSGGAIIVGVIKIPTLTSPGADESRSILIPPMVTAPLHAAAPK